MTTITGHSTEANTRLCNLPPLTRTIISCTDVNINNSSPSSSHTSTCRNKACHITTGPLAIIVTIIS